MPLTYGMEINKLYKTIINQNILLIELSGKPRLTEQLTVSFSLMNIFLRKIIYSDVLVCTYYGHNIVLMIYYWYSITQY